MQKEWEITSNATWKKSKVVKKDKDDESECDPKGKNPRDEQVQVKGPLKNTIFYIWVRE